MVEISALTDAQLNRAMIWCYPPKGKMLSLPEHYLFLVGPVNYLADWNLTMPLAVENDCAFLPRKGDSRGLLAQVCINKPSGNYEYFEGESLRNPLRAICEVLVMIKLRDKQ